MMRNNERMAQFFEMAGALLFAMIGIIIFGWPEGSIAAGALVVWMFTFMHLNRKVDMVLRELRHARQMSWMRYDGGGERQAMSVVPLSRQEEEEEEA